MQDYVKFLHLNTSFFCVVEDVKCNDGKEYDVVIDDNFAITSKREDVD
jgi:hypothetical protein